MPENNSKIRTISLSLCLMMVMAAATAAWAVSTEVHNYRLSNISSRLEEYGSLLLVHDREIIKTRADVNFIKAGIEEIKIALRRVE